MYLLKQDLNNVMNVGTKIDEIIIKNRYRNKETKQFIQALQNTLWSYIQIQSTSSIYTKDSYCPGTD